MAPILLIKYAVAHCTAEQVTEVLNQRFGVWVDGVMVPVVDRVVTINKRNFTTGAPFHMFFIHLKPVVSEPMQRFLDQFKTTSVQNIMYQEPWFWKVIIAQPRPDLEIANAVSQMPDWMPR